MKKNYKILSLLIISIIIFSCILSACSNGFNMNLEFKDADLLAISYDRLENADLSFNFSMEKSVYESNVEMNYANTEKTDVIVDYSVNENIYEVHPRDLQPLEYTNAGGIFDFCKGDADTMSKYARSIVDYAIDYITVMDTCVVDLFGGKIVLKYDLEKDIVTVLKHDKMDGIRSWENYCIINVYYNEDGNETVEMWYYYWDWDRSGQVGVIGVKSGNTKHIIYTPNNYYHYSNYSWRCDEEGTNKVGGTYQEAIAYKENGEWRCITQRFKKNHPIFTNGGTWDFVNDNILITFFVEKKGTMYAINKIINPYRNGYLVSGQDVLLLPEDEYEIDTESLNRSGIGYNGNIISIDLSILKGWEKVIISDKSHSYVLNNGDTVMSHDLWLSKYGWYTGHSGQIDLDQDFDKVIKIFNPGYWTVDDKIVSYTVGLQFLRIFNNHLFDYIGEEQLLLIEQFLKENGLSFINSRFTYALSELFDINSEIDDYANEIYHSIFGCQLTVEQFKKTALEVINKLDLYEKNFCDIIGQYEEIGFEDMPQKPKDINLVSISDKFVGEMIISTESVDFSNLKLDINKSVIFSSNNQYNIFIGWSNSSGTVFLDAFEKQIYKQRQMQFLGKPNVPLPKIFYEGEYTLVAFLGKQTIDGKKIRLSEVITNLPVKNFEIFEMRFEVESGYFLHKFYFDKGLIKLKVTFIEDCVK